jgi:hypothetical protein
VIVTTADFLVFATLVLIFDVVPLTQEMGKEETTQAPTPQHAASNQLTDNLLLVASVLTT